MVIRPSLRGWTPVLLLAVLILSCAVCFLDSLELNNFCMCVYMQSLCYMLLFTYGHCVICGCLHMVIVLCGCLHMVIVLYVAVYIRSLCYMLLFTYGHCVICGCLHTVIVLYVAVYIWSLCYMWLFG